MHSIFFEAERNRFYIEFEGVLCYDLMKDAFLDVLHHPDFRKSMDMVLDFKNILGLAPIADAIKFGKFQDSVADKRGYGFRSAVVCRQEEFFQQVLIHTSYAKSTEAEAVVFKSREEALNWLDEAKAS